MSHHTHGPSLSVMLQVAGFVALVATLLVTLQMARAAQAQAGAAQKQADEAARQADLTATVTARPLLSVCGLSMTWEGDRPRAVQLAIGNMGQGAAFNVTVRVDGMVEQWSVRWYDDAASEAAGAYGGMRAGDVRPYIGQVATERREPDQYGAGELAVIMECFDVLQHHYIFIHQFATRVNSAHVREVALTFSVDEDAASDQA